MAFSLAPLQVTSPSISTSSTRSKTKMQFQGLQKVCASNQNSDENEMETTALHRRNMTLGLGGLMLGLSINDQTANAAGKRAPPKPPQEKKDLSMTALQAKVLANKKRREAMKEEVARLRNKGKPVTSPSE